MDWIKVLKLLLDGKGIVDKAKTVKKLSDYADKLSKKDPESLTWDDLKFFSNKTMDDATNGLRQILKNCKAAEKAKLEWPKCNSLPLWMEWAKVQEKYGSDSPQFEKARNNYVAELKKFDKNLTAMAATLKAAGPKLAQNVKIAEVMFKYGDLLNKALMTFAKVPSLRGTAHNAMFVSLSQDAVQYRGIAGDVGRSMTKLVKINAGYQKECAAKIKDNQDWIKFALTPEPKKDGVIKKNTKSAKPKK